MSLNLDAEDVKEAEEFFTRLGGGFASSLEQLFFDWLYRTNPGLATNPLFARATPDMPQWSDFLVALGLNVSPWAAALLLEDDASKKGRTNDEKIAHAVRQFFEGGTLYTAPRLIRIPEVNLASK
jgi:hypothetical protein